MIDFGIGLDDPVRLPVNVVKDYGGRATNGECGRQYGVRLQVERWLDFLRQFITEKQEPAARKRQSLWSWPAKLTFPPGIQGCEESALILPASCYPVGTEFNGVSGKGKQDVESAQRRSGGRALQQKWITLWSELVQSRQIDGLRQGAYMEIFLTIPPVHGGELS